MAEKTMQWETPDGWKLHAVADEPQAAVYGVVCMIHGLGDHSGRYAHIRRRLAASGLAAWGFDLRGHGQSDGKPGAYAGLEAMLDDVGLLLAQARQAHPGAPVFLFGHSLGGSLALNYVMRRKPALSGVVSTSPALRTAFAPPAWKVTLGRLAYRLAPGLVMPNGLELAAISRDPIEVQAYRSDPLVHDRLSARLGVDLLEMGEWALAHASEFPVDLPLLLVHGSADRITSPDATQEFARGVQSAAGRCMLKIWDGLYHETHNEPEKEQVLAFLVDWLLIQIKAL